MSSEKTDHVMGFFLNQELPSIVRAEGVYLYDDQGQRIIDASGGAIVCSLGHGLEGVAGVVAQQMEKGAPGFRRAFRTPPLREAAPKPC